MIPRLPKAVPSGVCVLIMVDVFSYPVVFQDIMTCNIPSLDGLPPEDRAVLGDSTVTPQTRGAIKRNRQ